ncbi:MAG: hypothetical protein ABIN97_02065, partial [Ginsengibacter sp.]
MASDGLVVATPGKPHTLDTIPIEGRILPKGSDIIKEINRIKRQDELLEKQAVSILETNEISKQVGFSSINTNANIRETNISIQSLNTWLKYANFLSLCIAALTGLYIVKEFYKDASPNLQPINIQLGR